VIFCYLMCASLSGDFDPYTPPECVTLHLHGKVYNHPNFGDDVFITTSAVESVDWKAGLATTRSRVYRILSVDEDYVKFCRNIPNPGPGTQELLAAVDAGLPCTRR